MSFTVNKFLILLLFSFFTTISPRYAVFIPSNLETNVYTESNKKDVLINLENVVRYIEAIGFEYHRYTLEPRGVLSVWAFNKGELVNIDFYQEFGGKRFGRTALFDFLLDECKIPYAKVFVFENKFKFQQSKQYCYYMINLNEFKGLVRDRKHTLSRRTSDLASCFPLTIEDSWDDVISSLDRFSLDLKKISTIFKFVSLEDVFAMFVSIDGCPAVYQRGIFVFGSKKYNLSLVPAAFVLAQFFRIRNFSISDCTDNKYVVEDDGFVVSVRVSDPKLVLRLNVRFGLCKEFFTIRFYEEGGRMSHGRRRLMRDIEREPYHFNIMIMEKRDLFEKRLQDGFNDAASCFFAMP